MVHHHRPEGMPTVVWATKQPPTIEVNIYGEMSGTVEQ
jgi:hypothetical protein